MQARRFVRVDASACWCPDAWACAWPCLSSMQLVCAILRRHLWPLWLHHIFRHYLITGTIFGKKLFNTKRVFWFSLQTMSKTFLILRIIYRDIVINVWKRHVKYSLFLSSFNENWVFSTDFRKKNLNIKFHKNTSSGFELYHADEHTDGHDEANSRFSQFCEKRVTYRFCLSLEFRPRCVVQTFTSLRATSLGAPYRCQYTYLWVLSFSTLSSRPAVTSFKG